MFRCFFSETNHFFFETKFKMFDKLKHLSSFVFLSHIFRIRSKWARMQSKQSHGSHYWKMLISVWVEYRQKIRDTNPMKLINS